MCHVKVEIRCKLSVLLEMCLLSLSSSEAFFFLESAPSEIPNPTKEEGPSCEEPWSPADTAYRHEYPVGRSFAGNDDTCCLIVACHEDRKESHVSRRVSPEWFGGPIHPWPKRLPHVVQSLLVCELKIFTCCSKFKSLPIRCRHNLFCNSSYLASSDIKGFGTSVMSGRGARDSRGHGLPDASSQHRERFPPGKKSNPEYPQKYGIGQGHLWK